MLEIRTTIDAVPVPPRGELEMAAAPVSVAGGRGWLESERSLRNAAAGSADAICTRALWSELALVVCFAFLPMLFSAASKVVWPEVASAKPFNYTGSFMLLRSFWLSVPILLLMRLRGESFSQFGLVQPRLFLDFAGGVGFWLCGAAACWLFWKGFWTFSPQGFSGGGTSASGMQFHAPEGMLSWGLLLLGSLGNGFVEELLFRGYLMTRLERLVGPVSSLYLATALFTAVHVYQGAAGMLTVTILGLVYGAGFYWLRRLWPIALGHAIADFVGFASL